jgi:myosin-5
MPEVDMAEVEPPPLLKDNTAFHFLQPQPEA